MVVRDGDPDVDLSFVQPANSILQILSCSDTSLQHDSCQFFSCHGASVPTGK